MASALKSTAIAGILRRLFSICDERLLLITTLAIAMVFPHALLGAFAYRVATTPVLWAHAFFVLLIYCLGFWIYGNQALAMKTWRIRLVACNGFRFVQRGRCYAICCAGQAFCLRYRPALGAL